MKILKEDEYEQFLDYNGEDDEGCKVIESTIAELAQHKTAMIYDNSAERLYDRGFGDRLVRGWGNIEQEPWFMMGMIQIQAKESESDILEKLSGLRFSGESLWDGFLEFED